MLGETINEWAGVFSPDMRWVAYVSLETGAAEVFVRPFRVSAQTGQPSFGEGKWQVSRDSRQLAAVAHRPGDRLQHGADEDGGVCSASEHHR